MTETKSIALLNKEISQELSDPAIGRALLATTFKGLTEPVMKQAIFEGVMRGFKFRDFLERNVYAIPFKDGYSLVTSIDYARKIGMKSGVVGKSAPSFEFDGKKLVSCTITIKRRVGQDIGEFTAAVYFDEYSTGKNLWNSKPRTMIAKVAEMHALRMACPEELSQTYTEDEFEKEKEEDYDRSPIKDDAKIISTGDDTRGIAGGIHSHSQVPSIDLNEDPIEQEVPVDEQSQFNMLKAKAIKKWPELHGIELDAKVKAFTGLPIKPENYKAIIQMLS